jgi:hypothetical protein
VILELVQNSVGFVFRGFFGFNLVILIESFLAEFGDHFIPACILFIAWKAAVFSLLIKFLAQRNDFFWFLAINSIKEFFVSLNGVAQSPERDFKRFFKAFTDL